MAQYRCPMHLAIIHPFSRLEDYTRAPELGETGPIMLRSLNAKIQAQNREEGREGLGAHDLWGFCDVEDRDHRPHGWVKLLRLEESEMVMMMLRHRQANLLERPEIAGLSESKLGKKMLEEREARRVGRGPGVVRLPRRSVTKRRRRAG